jgi:hypothetical protein
MAGRSGSHRRLELAALEAAVTAEDAGGFAPQVGGHIDAAGDRQVGTEPHVADVGKLDQVAPAGRHRLPQRNRLAVQDRFHIAAGHGDHRVGFEAGLKKTAGDLQPGFARGIAHQDVAQSQGHVVKSTRGRHALAQVAQAPRPVFHQCFDTAVYDLQHFCILL